MRHFGLVRLFMFVGLVAFSVGVSSSLAACSTQHKYEAATAGVDVVNAALHAFVAFDQAEESRIAHLAISSCTCTVALVDGAVTSCATSDLGAARESRNACIDDKLRELRADYDKRKAPVLVAIRAYHVSLRLAKVGLEDGGAGAVGPPLGQAIGDVLSAVKSLGVEVGS